MNVFLNSQLIIDYPTDEVWQWVKRNFVMDNPEYLKKVKMGKWLGNTPRYIEFYSYDKSHWRLTLPFGAWRSFFKKFDGQFSAFSEIKKIEEKIDYHSNIQLYGYQEEVCQNVLKHKNGIVVAPCGSGKTKSALESVARIGGKTLWLTHTKDLMNQAKRNAEECFDLPKEAFGTITNGKENPGTVITFATVQTLSKINLEQYKDAFDVIVVDEAHHCAGGPGKTTMFYKVLSQLSARYKIGLTATPFRSDGLEKSMYAILGEIIGTVEQNQIGKRICPVKVKMIDIYWEPDANGEAVADKSINYAKLVDELIEDKDRFGIVSSKVNSLEGPVIVLANRISYLQKLQENYPKKSVCLSGLKTTKKNKELRDNALDQLNSGKIDCVFCTYQLAAEGLDVPNLRYVVFATPEKYLTKVQQAAGRVGRSAEGKAYGTVIDFVDSFDMYRGWAEMRYSIYHRLGYEIEVFQKAFAR